MQKRQISHEFVPKTLISAFKISDLLARSNSSGMGQSITSHKYNQLMLELEPFKGSKTDMALCNYKFDDPHILLSISNGKVFEKFIKDSMNLFSTFRDPNFCHLTINDYGFMNLETDLKFDLEDLPDEFF